MASHDDGIAYHCQQTDAHAARKAGIKPEGDPKRYRSYVVNGIVNLIQGYSFERPLPIMQMNEYDLSAIHKLLYENKCGEVYTRFSDHDGALGVLLFFRKKSITPL